MVMMREEYFQTTGKARLRRKEIEFMGEERQNTGEERQTTGEERQGRMW